MGILDSISSASLGVSTRKLVSAYAGACLRVRRASDDAEQDIGFSGDLIDVASLESFCSGTDGFVVTWYDQSGAGNDLDQPTIGLQPQIVSGGSALTGGVAGRVVVRFESANDAMLGGPTYSSGAYTIAVTLSYRSAASQFRRAVNGAGSNWLIGPYNNKLSHYAGGWVAGGDVAGTAVVQDQYYACVARNSGSASAFYVDGVDTTVSSTPIGFPGELRLGKSGAVAEPHDGDIVEMFAWPAALSTGDRETVESSMISYLTPLTGSGTAAATVSATATARADYTGEGSAAAVVSATAQGRRIVRASGSTAAAFAASADADERSPASGSAAMTTVASASAVATRRGDGVADGRVLRTFTITATGS